MTSKSQEINKEIKVAIHIPEKITDTVKQRKINIIYDILSEKNVVDKSEPSVYNRV